jgi:hypothetical protein
VGHSIVIGCHSIAISCFDRDGIPYEVQSAIIIFFILPEACLHEAVSAKAGMPSLPVFSLFPYPHIFFIKTLKSSIFA